MDLMIWVEMATNNLMKSQYYSEYSEGKLKYLIYKCISDEYDRQMAETDRITDTKELIRQVRKIEGRMRTFASRLGQTTSNFMLL